MILAYKFIYTYKTPYLTYFLHYYAQKSNLEFSITFQDNEIVLYVKASDDELLKFSDESMALIPNSIFLVKSSVEAVDEMPSSNVEIPTMKFANITPFMIKNQTKNEYELLSEISVFRSGEFVDVNDSNFSELLDFCKINLAHNQTIKFKNKSGEFEIENGLNFKSDFIMPTSFLSINKVFVIDEKNLISLASFEKPIINLKLNAIFRDNHEDSPRFFDVKGASDFFIFSLLNELYKDDIFFVSIKANFESFKALVLDDEIVVVNSGVFKSSSDSYDITVSDNIYFKDSKSLVKFMEFQSFEEIKDKILSDETGKKLFENYIKNHKFPVEIIKNSTNFLDLLDIASKVLFDKDKDYIIAMANDFLGTKGPRIDYLMSEAKFDTIKFIKSGMSYKLAGVDERVLAYGYLESLVHFCDDYIGDLKTELNIDSIVLKGEIFSTKAGAKIAKNIICKTLNAKFGNPLNEHKN